MACQYNLNLLFLEPKEHKHAMIAAKEAGIGGATTIYARGMTNNKLLQFFGMDHLRKEVLLMICPEVLTATLHKSLQNALGLEKRGHGLDVSLPLVRVMGLYAMTKECWKGDHAMPYELITIIVDNGKADDVVDAAEKAGAHGATIMHGRGSGAEKVERFINLEIEPEKEVILILAPNEDALQIIEQIRTVVDFEAANSGILFSLGVSQVSGIVK